MNDYDYDFKWDERYCYPNSNVLINKLGIMDEKKLHDAEREITSLRIASAKFHPIPGDLNLDHLRAIHQYIFGDIYEWAGELRWVDIAKGNVFCHAQYIEQNAECLFYQLHQEDCLKKTPPEKLPLRRAYYLSEINVIHPFREGNGRAQRLFIEYLAGQNGYMVDFSTVSNTEMIEACALAFGRNYDLMNQLMQRITARTI